MLGSDSRWRNPWNGFIASSSNVAPARSIVTWRPPKTLTTRPLAAERTSSYVAAMPSTACIATASDAGELTARSTVLTAQSTFRPRTSAIERILAMASFFTFSPSVPGMSSPCPPTGDAAPISVPGAMSATFAARVMKVPALAARPPAGATQTIVGIVASRSALTIVWVAWRSPPGVSRRMTTAGAPACSARAIPSAR